MSWSFCDSRHVKITRKEHKCVFCGRVIPEKSPNIYNWYGMYDGEFQNSYSCHWCEDNKDRLIDSYDNEIMDFWDCIREDIFYDKLKELKAQFDDVEMKFEGDYLVFYSEELGEPQILYDGVVWLHAKDDELAIKCLSNKYTHAEIECRKRNDTQVKNI